MASSSSSSSSSSPPVWSAIVLTCQNKTSADAFKKELDIRQNEGFIDKNTLILAIEDPKSRVGSGGATLNALLVVTEHLSAKAGFTTIDASVISKSRILIMHMGRDYPFSPCGRAFTTLPAKHSNSQSVSLADSLVTNFDCLLHYLTNNICCGSPNGVWVSSTDMMLSVPSNTEINWTSISEDIVLLLYEGDVDDAKRHGVCKLDDKGIVKNMIYKGSEEELKDFALANGKVPIVGSTVFFNEKAVAKLLTLHSYPPLDACTYYGLDNGAKPIQIALFFHILLTMATDISKEDFECGKPSGAYGKSTRTGVKKLTDEEMDLMTAARKTLWTHLRGMKVQGVVMKDCKFRYMFPNGLCHRILMFKFLKLIKKNTMPCDPGHQMHIATEGEGQTISESAVVMNSVIKGPVKVGDESVVSHCYLQGNTTVGNKCVVSGIGSDDWKVNEVLQIPDHLCLLGYNISFPHVSNKYSKVFVMFGINDNLEATRFLKTKLQSNSQLNLLSKEAKGSFCNEDWKTFFERTGIRSSDLWMPGLPEENRTLFNARLFPVVHHVGDDNDDPPLYDCLWLAGIQTKASNEKMVQRWCSSLRVSLKEILSNIDLGVEFDTRRQLFFDIGRRHVEAALLGATNECFLPFLKTCALEGFHKEILETMDNVASSSGSSMGVAARTLACIADVLGAMAGEKAGLRSGPAQNIAWKPAFQLLEDKETKEGVKALALERSMWMDRPDLLVRAARHYEGAEQILRRHAVMTAKQFMKFEETEKPPMGHWVVAEAPVRIDFSGGWTDTPPIAYEHGGVVTNVAIKLNGKKPLVVKAKRIPEFQIILVILAGEHSTRLVCEKLDDLANYSQPHAPGALIKACFCAASIIVLDSPKSLADQLKERYGGGFEVHSAADIPYGSGLGTSSILAGVVMGAVLRAAGLTADVTSLIHAVMVVEQMLTCGGGWQDNVGGLAPGFKIASSKAELPIEVTYEVLKVSDSMIDQLNKCLVFVYTGKTRLAKNLLQNVVRNWYGRQPNIVKVVDDLAENAKTLAKALEDGDLALFGQCVSNYREHKKLIAPGTEPEDIRKMMEAIQPYVYGQCLAGAGGGGFLCAIAKSPEMAGKIKETLGNKKFSDEVAFHEVSIDNEGLTIRIE